MSEIYVNKLLAVSKISSPRRAPSESDWLKFESDLGVELPDDYKKLITKLGDGLFGELYVLNPSVGAYSIASNKARLIDFCGSLHYVFNKIKEQPYSNINGLIPIGALPNGAGLFCQKASNKYGFRLLFIDYGLFIKYEISVSFCEFLYNVFTLSHKFPSVDIFHGLIWGADDLDSSVFFSQRK